MLHETFQGNIHFPQIFHNQLWMEKCPFYKKLGSFCTNSQDSTSTAIYLSLL